MISLENARKWSGEAADNKWQKALDQCVIKIGDDWVQTFRDRMSIAMIEAIKDGGYEASVRIHSPKYKTHGESDSWQEFIRPELENLLQEYEALGFKDGANECAGAERLDWFYASYTVHVDWGLRKLRPGLQRVRYA